MFLKQSDIVSEKTSEILRYVEKIGLGGVESGSFGSEKNQMMMEYQNKKK